MTSQGAEIGPTTSLFPFNDRMYDYLKATKRQAIDDFSREYAAELREDEGAQYDELIEIDLNTLEPHTSTVHSPRISPRPSPSSRRRSRRTAGQKTSRSV